MSSTSTDRPDALAKEPLILSRAEHPISRKDIDEDALRVLYRLASFGYLGYLVGGGVRDLFLQKRPKDFDVGTDARPSRLKKIFKNCRIIGRRFRIAHVFFPQGKIVEVSTFRRGGQTTVKTSKGTILSDNEYGSPQEDALRRDLTINGLFYDIDSFSVIDYVGGVQDLRDRIVRTIADPDASFKEDPVRMIRVQRHAARTGFQIEPNTLRAIYENRNEIRHSNGARLLEESLKDLRGGAAAPFFRLMLETQLLDCLLPELATQLRDIGEEHPFWPRMKSVDSLLERGATFTTPLLLSVLLHTLLFRDASVWQGTRNNPPDVWRYLTAHWREISKHLRVSRRDTERVTQILISHRKLILSYERKQLLGVLHKKPYLSEALDFLEIALEAQGLPTEILKEWRKVAPPPPPPEHRYRVFADRGIADRNSAEGGFANSAEHGFAEGDFTEGMEGEGETDGELALDGVDAAISGERGEEIAVRQSAAPGHGDDAAVPPRKRRRRGGRRRSRKRRQG